MTFCYSGLDDNYNEYGERNLGTLPKDRTLGYGVPEQPAAYMSGPTDVSDHWLQSRTVKCENKTLVAAGVLRV